MPLSDAIRGMSLYWDLATGRLACPYPPAVTRGELAQFTARLARGNTATALPAGTTLRGTLRLAGQFDAEPLLQFGGFEAGAGTGIYQATAAITGARINSALAIDGDETNDLDQVEAFLTLAILQGSTLVSVSRRLPITLFSAADGDDEASALTLARDDITLARSDITLATLTA